MAICCNSDLPDLPLLEEDISGDSSNDSMLLRFVTEERRMVSLASKYVSPGDKEQNNVTKNDTMSKSYLCGTMAPSRSDSGNSDHEARTIARTI